MYNFRTDLAVESNDIYKRINKIENNISGVEIEEESLENNTKITRIEILNSDGENALGKPIGKYITIQINELKSIEDDVKENISNHLSNEIKNLVDTKLNQIDEILVVGLGNWNVTPDALGPKVVSYVDVTRHLLEYIPQYMEPNTRSVSAVSPGVLGTTGIETLEILKGIVEKTTPKLIIAIDSLASRNVERISTTIQLSDTGITPGAGVGNKRKELSLNTLGIPVIAIGVPTVVDAATIASDSLDLFIDKMKDEIRAKEINGEDMKKIYNFLEHMKNQDKYEIMKEILMPSDYNYIVTPKEIDAIITNMSSIIAHGINKAM